MEAKSATAHMLARQRVNRALDQMLQYPLSVIRASMGFGKTTAVREYLRLRRIPYIYIPLVGAGSSLEYCWARLTAQICKESEPLGIQLKSLGFPQDAAQTAMMVELLSRALGEKQGLVVIDDYHLIDCPRAAGLITLLAGERIPNLHLVLLAREMPCLPVTDLEQKGLCWVVDQETLRFRVDEVKRYLRLRSLAEDERAAEEICSTTGGWITGIYLVTRGMEQGRPPARRSDTIDRLIEQNLYSGYDLFHQKLLQKLSFLDTFLPEEAAFVLEDRAVPSILKSLSLSNAFLTCDRASGAYQMTDLFRDFLRNRAWQEALEPETLYHRAGQWQLKHGNVTLAYEYLYRAGEIETILKDLDVDATHDIHIAQSPQIQKIFAALPANTAFRYPLAYLRYLRVAALWGNMERHQLAARLGGMEQYFSAQALPLEEKSRILGEIENTWVFGAFNDAEQVVAHAEKAVAHFKGRFSHVVSNRTEFTFGSPELLYCYYKEPGRLHDTAQFISAHFHMLTLAANGCGSGSEALALAEYALETGSFESVRLSAERAIYQSRPQEQVSVELCATFALVRLALLEGRAADSARLMDTLRVSVGRQNSAILNTTFEVCSAYIDTCLGRLENIPGWLCENDMEPGCFMFQGMAFNHIVCARAVLLSGNYMKLDVLCETFHRRFDIYSNQLGYVHNHICRAVAREKLYGREEGLIQLRLALDVGAADHIIMPFAETAPYLLPMLRELSTEEPYSSAYLAELISCCERYIRTGGNSAIDKVVLTEREHEILLALAQGATHREIAKELYISVPTVRFHIKNTYRKLEASNKLNALRTAEKLGLIQ